MLETAPRELAALEASFRILAEAQSLTKIKSIRDKAEAARFYARASGYSPELQNRAAELKLRAERKAGRLLSSLRLRGGDRRSIGCRTVSMLERLGISRDQSRRWQQLAAVAEEQFSAYILAMQSQNLALTSAGLLRFAMSTQLEPVTICAEAEQAAPHETMEETAVKETIEEVINHVELLADILRPIYELDEGDLKRGEKRAVGQLLRDSSGLLLQVRNALPGN